MSDHWIKNGCLFGLVFLILSCHEDDNYVNHDESDTTKVSNVDLSIEEPVSAKKKFQSEEGLFKMIRENYLDVLTDSSYFLILPVVSGCSCSLISFEEMDSNVNAFKSNSKDAVYWLLRGENAEYTDKISNHHLHYAELEKPIREFADYGLYHSSHLIFKISQGNRITDWMSVQ